MAYAHSIPGYAFGFRFANSPEFYDPTANRFIDQAGYDHLSGGLPISVGTPSFITYNGQPGMTLDNTVQGGFFPGMAWEGFIIVVMRPVMSANGSLYPLIYGGASLVTNNGTLRLVRVASNNYRHRATTLGDALVTDPGSDTAGAIRVSVHAFSQSTRSGYGSWDASSFVTSGPVGAATNGNGVAPGACTASAVVDSPYVRFGNISGVAGDTSATTNTMQIMELQGFIDPNQRNSAATQAFVATLKARYGTP